MRVEKNLVLILKLGGAGEKERATMSESKLVEENATD